MILTSTEVASFLLQGGFQGWDVRTMGAIAMAESGRNKYAHGLNTSDPESPAYLSEDHGLLQVNDYWGPLVLSQTLLLPFHQSTKSFSQLAKDPVWNCKAAHEMFVLRWLDTGVYKLGFTCWSAYNRNKHLPYMEEAYKAAVAVGAIIA